MNYVNYQKLFIFVIYGAIFKINYFFQYDGCYSVGDGQGAVVIQNNNGGGGDTGNIVVPSGQYFVPQPTLPQPYQEMAYAVPATYYPQDPNVPQIIQFRRSYEPPNVLEVMYL